MRARSAPWTAMLGIAAIVALGAYGIALTKMPISVTARAEPRYVPAVAALTLASLVVVVWRVEPAYTLSAAVLLTPFAGNWPQLGIPGPLSPDRLLLAGAILAVLLRSPSIARGPRLRIVGTHWLLLLAALYALGSAYLAGTITNRDAFLKIVDAFGIMPFLLFLVAPLAFRTPAQRRVLMTSFVVLGAYLSLTTVFEIAKLDALVFPKYILDPNYGIHAGRGRGPFVDAVANGLALYTCAVICVLAAGSWVGREARAFAIAIGLLCVVGAFISLERSVWIGAALGTIVAMIATPPLRRYFVPTAIAMTLSIVCALLVIPGLEHRVQTRANNSRTLWDRKNLARAAVNMVDAKPLFGFGWSRFSSDSADYFQQAFDYPLTSTSAGIHNTPLTYAVDLGLVGASLWAIGILFGVGTALMTRGPPDLMRWRAALLAVAVASLVVMNSVPPTAWLNRCLWLLAGIVYSGRYLGWYEARDA